MATCFVSFEARADAMSAFLKNCAYGTLAGAAVGLASLAISDNPSGRINNVARGASLGLYFGIGFGIYELNRPLHNEEALVGLSDSKSPLIWLTPVMTGKSLETGAQLHWIARTF